MLKNPNVTDIKDHQISVFIPDNCTSIKILLSFNYHLKCTLFFGGERRERHCSFTADNKYFKLIRLIVFLFVSSVMIRNGFSPYLSVHSN